MVITVLMMKWCSRREVCENGKCEGEKDGVVCKMQVWHFLDGSKKKVEGVSCEKRKNGGFRDQRSGKTNVLSSFSS